MRTQKVIDARLFEKAGRLGYSLLLTTLCQVLRATWPREQSTRLWIVNEVFLHRIPLQLAAQHEREVTQMARSHRAMMRVDIGDRIAAIF